jgi:NAD(P)-dependent dehydrogenase (short-subunit alcohol dehydrogenase family)
VVQRGGQRGLALETQFDVYRRIMEIDFFAPLRLTQLLLPAMVERRGQFRPGRIGRLLRTSSSWRSCRYLNYEFPPCTTRRRVLQSFDGLIEWIDSFDHGSYFSSIDHATNVFQLYSAGLCEKAEVVITNSTGVQLHWKTYAPHDKDSLQTGERTLDEMAPSR